MDIKDYFINNGYHLVSEYYSEKYFSNRGYTFEKDDILFIYSCEMGRPYLEFNKKGGNKNSIIGIFFFFLIEDGIMNDKIIMELLNNNYKMILKKIRSLSESEIVNIKKQYVIKRYGINI